jgi:hypothetical protein
VIELRSATNQLTALAELVEAEFMYQYEAGTSSAVAAALGIATTRIGGGVALSMRNEPSGYWNKALGFGVREPVTDDLVARVLDFYRTEGHQGTTIQIAPAVLPIDWPDIRARHNLTPGGQIVKLCCPVDACRPPANRTRLRVGPVDPAHARTWASVVLRGLGMPSRGLVEMLAASVAAPGFRPFAAWDGDDIVGGANLYVHGQVGSLNAASTLPSHRGQGAQSALIAARAEQAAAEGCHWLVAEAGNPPVDGTNSSLNNMRRTGLRELYVRQNWLWKSPITRPAHGSRARLR